MKYTRLLMSFAMPHSSGGRTRRRGNGRGWGGCRPILKNVAALFTFHDIFILFVRPSPTSATQVHPLNKTMLSHSEPEADAAAAATTPVLDWAQIERDTMGLVEQLTPPPPMPSAITPSRPRHKPDKVYMSELGRSLAVLTEQVGRLELFRCQGPEATAAGGPRPPPPEATATIPPADHDGQRSAPSFHQYEKTLGPQPHFVKRSDHPAAQDGTRALLCLMQYSRHQRMLLHQQYGLDQFRALIDSNLLFDSIGWSKEEALAMRVAELEDRVQELEKRADKPVLPPPPAEEESSRVLQLERALHKVRKCFEYVGYYWFAIDNVFCINTIYIASHRAPGNAGRCGEHESPDRSPERQCRGQRCRCRRSSTSSYYLTKNKRKRNKYDCLFVIDPSVLSLLL